MFSHEMTQKILMKMIKLGVEFGKYHEEDHRTIQFDVTCI